MLLTPQAGKNGFLPSLCFTDETTVHWSVLEVIYSSNAFGLLTFAVTVAAVTEGLRSRI